MSGFRTIPTLPIVSLPTPPRTAREARKLAREMNEDTKRRRAQKAADQAARQREFDEINRRARRRDRNTNGISPTAVYRERATQADLSESERTKLETARSLVDDIIAGGEELENPSGDQPDSPVNPASVYAERRNPGHAKTAPSRPRTFGELARTIYGPHGAAAQVIPTSDRGGNG